jgi:5-methylcytosine-specific restriction endonuclease McrA
MSLPRHLRDKLDADWCEFQGSIALDALCAGADYGPRVFEVLERTKKSNGDLPAWWHAIRCFIVARWAYFGFRQFHKNCPDEMERVAAKFYVGLEELSNGGVSCEWRSVTVPIYFVKKLERLNAEREARDRSNAKIAAEIGMLRNKIYLSRCFPSRLRLIIFERDKYRCQICLRHRETLLRLGRHLEVDHILAFVDGGKTTYSNGITVCDECNIAKHHAKGYLAGTEALASPVENYLKRPAAGLLSETVIRSR